MKMRGRKSCILYCLHVVRWRWSPLEKDPGGQSKAQAAYIRCSGSTMVGASLSQDGVLWGSGEVRWEAQKF